MADKKFDNNNRIAGWKYDNDNGGHIISVRFTLDDKDYVATLYHNENVEGKRPNYSGKIKLADKK